jgi:hypothetical protein
MRRVMIGLAAASAVAAILSPVPSYAQPFAPRLDIPRPPLRGGNMRPTFRVRTATPTDRNAPEPASRDVVPPDLDQRRRDGHMTPEERRLLRQHIEDAVRELYKR